MSRLLEPRSPLAFRNSMAFWIRERYGQITNIWIRSFRSLRNPREISHQWKAVFKTNARKLSMLRKTSGQALSSYLPESLKCLGLNILSICYVPQILAPSLPCHLFQINFSKTLSNSNGRGGPRCWGGLMPQHRGMLELWLGRVIIEWLLLKSNHLLLLLFFFSSFWQGFSI